MNLAETHDLLTLVAALDNRRFGDENVVAWHQILGDLPIADCRAAVLAHFAERVEYLMPAHVRRGALDLDHARRRESRIAIEASQAEAETARPGNRRADVEALIAQLRDSLPPVDPIKFRRPEWVEHERRQARALASVPNPHYDPTARERLAEDAA